MTNPTDLFTESLAEAIAKRLRADQQQVPRVDMRLFGINEAAIYMGRTPSAIRQLINDGKIKVTRIDSRVQIDRTDLDELIDKSKN